MKVHVHVVALPETELIATFITLINDQKKHLLFKLTYLVVLIVKVKQLNYC